MQVLASNKVSHGSDAEWKYTYYTLEEAEVGKMGDCGGREQ
jgi:hypothetical protein